ncbi:hypothetical protein [Methylobacterium aquaticum]|nr:hypothetical protein [Methylobacterium aquaticum]
MADRGGGVPPRYDKLAHIVAPALALAPSAHSGADRVSNLDE